MKMLKAIMSLCGSAYVEFEDRAGNSLIIGFGREDDGELNCFRRRGDGPIESFGSGHEENQVIASILEQEIKLATTKEEFERLMDGDLEIYEKLNAPTLVLKKIFDRCGAL